MDKEPLMVAIYARVSTTAQDTSSQLREVEAYVRVRGWKVVEVYEDQTGGRNAARPALQRLINDAKRLRFQCVLVWKLDRFARSLIDCLELITQLDNAGVRFIAVSQGLDTDQKNPASRFMLQVLGAAAEFERTLIHERVVAGQQRYRADFEAGKAVKSRSGLNKAPHRPRKNFNRQAVVDLRAQGWSIRRIARELRIGLGTVSRTLEAFHKPAPDEGHPVVGNPEVRGGGKDRSER